MLKKITLTIFITVALSGCNHLVHPKGCDYLAKDKTVQTAPKSC